MRAGTISQPPRAARDSARIHADTRARMHLMYADVSGVRNNRGSVIYARCKASSQVDYPAVSLGSSGEEKERFGRSI